jgi:hypothetical protein
MKGLDGMDARHPSATNKISGDVTSHAPILAGKRPATRVVHALGPLISRGHCLACRLLDACHYLGRSRSPRRRKGYLLTRVEILLQTSGDVEKVSPWDRRMSWRILL